jgi:hypothetical protein
MNSRADDCARLTAAGLSAAGSTSIWPWDAAPVDGELAPVCAVSSARTVLWRAEPDRHGDMATCGRRANADQKAGARKRTPSRTSQSLHQDQSQHDHRLGNADHGVDQEAGIAERHTPLVGAHVVDRVRITSRILDELRESPVNDLSQRHGKFVVLLFGDLQPDQPVTCHSDRASERGGLAVLVAHAQTGEVSRPGAI